MIIKKNIILLILIIGGIKSETCENISHQWLTNAFKIGSHIKTHNFVQLILDAIETFHIIDRAYNNCESLGEFYEMNYSQLNDEGQLCIEGLFNEYDWIQANDKLEKIFQENGTKSGKGSNYFRSLFKNWNQKLRIFNYSQITLRINKMAFFKVTNVQFDKSIQDLNDDLILNIQFDCLKKLSGNLEWKLIYIGDALDSEQDQILDTIVMESVDTGNNEFEWVISPPKYSQLADPFSVFDTTALVLTLSYQNSEFLRISYLLVHRYKLNQDNENPPETIQWEKIERVIKTDSPVQKYSDISWN